MSSKRFQEEIREQMISYILAAFGFVTGLAWNEAIQSLIKYLVPQTGNSVLAKFSYAFLITITLVIIASNLRKFSK